MAGWGSAAGERREDVDPDAGIESDGRQIPMHGNAIDEVAAAGPYLREPRMLIRDSVENPRQGATRHGEFIDPDGGPRRREEVHAHLA